MFSLGAVEPAFSDPKDRLRFWGAALLIHLVVGAIAVVGLSLAISNTVADRTEQFERDVDVAATAISRDLVEFEYAVHAASMRSFAELVFLHDGAGKSQPPGWQGEKATAVLASYVIDEQGVVAASWGDTAVLDTDVALLAELATESGASQRTEWLWATGALGNVAWARPILSRQPWSPGVPASTVVGAYVVVSDLECVVEHEMETLTGVTGQQLTFAVDGAVDHESGAWVEARAAIPGTPYVARLAQRRIDVVTAEWPLMLYGALAAFSIASTATLGYGSLMRARQQRDTERFARELLSERITSEERFLAAMSHEMRTPLNSIIGFAGVMLDELAGPVSEEQRRQLWMIERSGRRLLALVSDVLDVSRIRAGQANPVVTRIDAIRIGSQALEIIEPSAAVKNIELVFEHADSEILIESDSGMLERILLNLLGNAVKFSDTGNVALEITRGTDSVNFVVRDQGPGVPETELDRIGDEFYQAPRSVSDAKPEGTGLGLPIAHRLARVLGGTLLTESEVGVGSVFTLVLPTNQRVG